MKRIKGLIAVLSLGCLLIASLSGCESAVDQGKRIQEASVYELKAIVLGTEPEQGMDELYEQLDALTLDELNCIVRFDFVPWGNEREQLNIAAASGEYDLIPNGNFSDYKQLISKNAFVDLNDYLEYVPTLVEHYKTADSRGLTACEIGGSLYGIPQYTKPEIQYDSEGFFYRKDLCDKWGLEKITSLETMEAYLYKAKEMEEYKDKPLITDNRIWQSLWIMLADDRYIEVGSMQETPFVVYDTKEGKVVNRVETPEFTQILEYIAKWNRDNILESDLLSVSDNEGSRGINLMNENAKPCETNVPIWSIAGSGIRALNDSHDDWTYDFFTYITVRDDYYMKGLADASVISVSSKCKSPEIAIKFIEKAHTDSRYYDLLQYGVEGISYNTTDGMVDYEGIDIKNRINNSVLSDYQLSRAELPVNKQFYDDAIMEHEKWGDEAIKKAVISPIADSSISFNGMQDEVKTLDAIRLKYFQPLVCGYYTDVTDKQDQLNNILIENGLQEYIDKLQSQYL